jgi:hypothetical protein
LHLGFDYNFLVWVFAILIQNHKTLPRLVSNSGVQAIFLPQPPTT